MGNQNYPRSPLDEIVNSRQGSLNTAIISDCTRFIEGNIEINPHQNPFTADIYVLNGHFFHFDTSA
jgi:hypothetical protein